MADNTAGLSIVVTGRDDTTHVLKGIESSIIRFVGAVASALTVLKITVLPIQQAAEFQRELLNVAKTTEFSNDQIKELGGNLKEMSYRLNVSAIDLAKVAAAGGQLGLGSAGVQGLTAFTETSARFASVLGVSVEESSSSLGKLRNLFNIAVSDVERISSTLNEISNNSTATGAELLDIIQRIGTAGGTLSLQQSAALAAYGKDLGLTSETVGTTLNKIFLDLQTKAAEVAPLVGMPVTNFANLVKTDGIAAFRLYIDSLANMGNVQRNIVSEQITGGGRIAAFVTAAINDSQRGFQLLNKELFYTNKGFSEGNSSIKEMERVMGGLLAQLTILKNVFLGVAESVGSGALPYLTELTKTLQEAVKNPEVVSFFKGLGDSIGGAIKTAVSLISALSSMSVVMGPLIRLLEIFVGVKVAQSLLGMTVSLGRTTASAWELVKAWTGLVTGNRAVISSLAEQTAKAQASNAALAQGGDGLGQRITLAGRLSLHMKAAMDSADALTRATTRLARSEQFRDKILADLDKRMVDLNNTRQKTAQQAYDAALTAAGGTPTKARAAERASLAQSTKEYNDMWVQRSNLTAAYQDRIAALTEEIKKHGIVSQLVWGRARVGVRALEMAVVSTIGAVTSLGASLLKTAAWSIAIGFVIQWILQAAGYLKPLLEGLKGLLGIRNDAARAADRESDIRQKALDEEIAQAAALAAQYKEAIKSWDKSQLPADKLGLPELINRLRLVKGELSNIDYTQAQFNIGIVQANAQVEELSKKLQEARKRKEELENTQEQDITNAKKKDFIFPAGDGVAERRVLDNLTSARNKVEELQKAYDVALQVQQYYTDSAVTASDGRVDALRREKEILQATAQSYTANGVQIIKVLQSIAQAENDLKKEREKLGERPSAEASGDEQDAYSAKEQVIRKLTAKSATLTETYKKMDKEASLADNRFLRALGVTGLSTAFDHLNMVVGIFGNVGTDAAKKVDTEMQAVASRIAQIENQIKRQDSLRAAALRDLDTADTARRPGLQNAPRGVNNASIERRVEGIDKEKRALQSTLELEKAKLKVLEQRKEEQETLTAAIGDEEKQARTQREGAEKDIQKLITGSLAIKLLKPIYEQQDKIVQAATKAAARMKSAWEEALQAELDAVKNANKEIRELDDYFAKRKTALNLAQFDVYSTEAERKASIQAEKDLAIDKQALINQGLQGEQLEDATRELEHQYKLKAQERQAASDEYRQIIEIEAARKRLNTLVSETISSQQAAAAATQQAKDAFLRGDSSAGASLAAIAADQAEVARDKMSELFDSFKDFKQLAGTPIKTTFGAKFVVDEKELTNLAQQISALRVGATQVIAEAFEQGNTGTQQAKAKADAELKNTTELLATAARDVAEVIKSTARLPEVAEAVAKVVKGAVDGAKDSVAILKSIGNVDTDGIKALEAVAKNGGNYKQMEEAFKNTASVLSTGILDKFVQGTATLDKLPDALTAAFRVTKEQIAQIEADNKKLVEGQIGFAAQLAKAKIEETKPQLNLDTSGVPGAVQNALNTGNPYKINIRPVVEGGSSGLGILQGARENASGGFISGPGTGLSDSILSWLSNGEYVMDARTTSMFGPSFFATLQKIARGGSAAIGGLFKVLGGGIMLPAFAGGGPVGLQGNISPIAGEGGRGLGTLKFDFGGGKVAEAKMSDVAAKVVADGFAAITKSGFSIRRM